MLLIAICCCFPLQDEAPGVSESELSAFTASWQADVDWAKLHSLPEKDAVRIQFSINGKYLATLSRQGVSRVWDVETGKLVGSATHLGSRGPIACSADGKCAFE